MTALGFFLLALGPLIHLGNITLNVIPAAVLNGDDVRSWTPYGLLNQLVPFMRISRSVSRFAIMVQLSISVLAGLGLATLLQWMRTPVTRGDAARPPWYRSLAAQYALVFLCVGGLLAEYWVAPFPVSPPDTPEYYGQLATDPDPRAVLNLPMNYDRPGYLLYQTVHGKPLTVAYISRDDPRTMTERSPVLQNFRHLGTDIIEADLAQVGLAMLADLEVGTVVLDRYKMPGGDERTVTEALTQAIFRTQAPVYADERITVYRVPQTVTPEPYLRLGPLNWGRWSAPRPVHPIGNSWGPRRLS
ncbi:MAG: hypothetical protein IPK16_27740 [Anaerolineales bacterium]|nr:hypothetical protein [Anaerolineales bacterium]